MKLQAKQLMTGDLITNLKVDEIVESVIRRENHVYVATDYSRRTGVGAYDYDKMQLVEVTRTAKGTVAAGIF